MRKSLVLGILLLISSSGLLSAPVQEEWARRYTSPGNRDDRGIALTVDGDGNVYVTGEECLQMMGPPIVRCIDSNVYTIKYDTTGNSLWVARYHGPAAGVNLGRAITLDGDGNVYVAAESEGGMRIQTDYATIKYDNNGNQLWATRYNGPASSFDNANAIAVDGDGNVYVTGASWGVDTSYDYATIKYDADGNELWVARYNGPGNSTDLALGLALDPNGYIYVTGWGTRAQGVTDYTTVKYDLNGNQLWVATYNDSGSGTDHALALALDADGNVYVTGDSTGTGPDYATVKYDPDGNQLWVARYDGPGHSTDVAHAIVVDPNGYVYVTGQSWGVGTRYDFATIQYDLDGNQLWVARYDGPANHVDAAYAMALDGNGNIYVTGESTDFGTESDYGTVKYDPSGNQLWAARYSGPGNGLDVASAIALDGFGNVYVTGLSVGAGTGQDFATIKYSQP